MNSEVPARRLGVGAAGQVQEIFNLHTCTIYAKKTFRDPADYKIEKKNYEDIKVNKQILTDLAIIPNHDQFNDNENSICFVPGMCSLQDLCNQNFQFDKQQIIHLFTRLLDFVLLLQSQGYCHRDLKPANATLVPVKQNNENSDKFYELKVIDFGSLSNSSEIQYYDYSPAHLINFQNLYECDYTQQNVFIDEEARYKNEFLSIIKIIQQCLVGKNRYEELSRAKTQEEKLRQIKVVQTEIEKQYGSQDDRNFSDILNFFRDHGINDQYEFEKDLKNLLYPLQQPNYRYFSDNTNAIKNFANNKRQELAEKELPISQLLGFDSYIEPFFSPNDDYTNTFNFEQLIENKLQQNDQKSLVIRGESGVGKTIFLVKLAQRLDSIAQISQQAIIIPIKLRAIASQAQSSNDIIQNLIKNIEESVGYNQQNLNQEKKLLVLLDGFDEINNRDIPIHQKLFERFKSKFMRFQIVATTRKQFASDSELKKCFGQTTQFINLCPFNEKQIKLFVQNYIQSYQKIKERVVEFEVIEDAQFYLDMFSKHQPIFNLAKIPFILTIMITIAPEILNQNSENTRQLFTRYNTYSLFIRKYMTNEAKRLICIDRKRKAICKEYPLRDSQKEQERISMLIEDAQLVNQKLSWNMLKEQKLKWNLEDSQNIQKQLDRIYGISSEKANLSLEISPKVYLDSFNNHESFYSYIHKSVYEFFIAQSIISETFKAKCEPIDERTTFLGTAFLRFDLDILTLVSEHVMELPLTLQYLLFFETWYKSVLLTRKIKSEKIEDQKEKYNQLEKIGSNCMNLLAGPYRCDLTKRDFSDCVIPYAYFYKRDLSGFERETTFGGLGISFGCTNAVFKECLFSPKEQENRAEKVFKIYECKEFIRIPDINKEQTDKQKQQQQTSYSQEAQKDIGHMHINEQTNDKKNRRCMIY